MNKIEREIRINEDCEREKIEEEKLEKSDLKEKEAKSKMFYQPIN